jgi:hypothetical protein
MVTLSVMPATGLPMPFVSYGGTALALSCFLAGLLLNIAGEVQGTAKVSRRRVSASTRRTAANHGAAALQLLPRSATGRKR